MAGEDHRPSRNRYQLGVNVLKEYAAGQDTNWVLGKWDHVQSNSDNPAFSKGQDQQQPAKTVDSAQAQHDDPATVVKWEVGGGEDAHNDAQGEEGEVVISVAEDVFVEDGACDAGEGPEGESDGHEFFLKPSEGVELL